MAAMHMYGDLDMHGRNILHSPDAFNCQTCTLEQYELMKANHTIDENTFYIITDDVTGAPPIIRISKAEYLTLVNEHRINEDAFYFVYDDDDPFIDDTVAATNKTYSSQKIEEMFAAITQRLSQAGI